MTVEIPKSMDLIWPELVRRIRVPWKSVTFRAYLVFGIVLCGGSGVLTIFLKSQWRIEEVSAALLGYFPALFGAAALEFTAEHQQYLRSLSFIALSVLIPVAFIVAKTEHGWQLMWSLLGTVLGILFWWIANGPNKRFEDVAPESALGGDASGNLPKSDTEWLQ